MQEITVQALKQLQDEKDDFQLIDVREPWEYEICSLGGILIPMEKAMTADTQITKHKQVIIYCYRGHRSAKVIAALEQAYGYDNLYNLTGGLEAYAQEIDPHMPTY